MNHSMKLGALWRAFLIDFLKNFILLQHEASAEKMCSIVIISYNSAQLEKLNICIAWYITNYQILEFPSSYFTTLKFRDVLNTTCFQKSKMLFSFDWDHNLWTRF